MRAILAALLLCFAAPALAGKPWDPVDKGLGTGLLVLHLIDWRQTRYISEHPERYRERNPFMSDHPSKAEVDRFFLVTGVLTYFIADWFEGDARKVFLGGVGIMKIGAVVNNHSIGIKIEW